MLLKPFGIGVFICYVPSTRITSLAYHSVRTAGNVSFKSCMATLPLYHRSHPRKMNPSYYPDSSPKPITCLVLLHLICDHLDASDRLKYFSQQNLNPASRTRLSSSFTSVYISVTSALRCTLRPLGYVGETGAAS